ncbi:MAG: hypothetical protein ACE5EP_03885 [Candidatus Methylomirabilales bacterium]
MIARVVLAVLFALMTAGVSSAVEDPWPNEIPSAVVRAYLQALLDGRYDQTYNYLSSKRQRHMTREDWVMRLKRDNARPRSQVLFMRVNPAIVRGEEATVVTSFRLKTPEGRKVSRETYNLVREGGQWRIDGIEVFDAPSQE